MKKKLSISQIRLILCLVMLAIFALSYQYIYLKYVDLAEEYEAKAIETRQNIDQRKIDIEQEDTLVQQTMEINQQIDDIIEAYPVRITKEDNLVFIEEMEQDLGIDIPSVTILDTTKFYDTILPIRGEQDPDDSVAVVDGTTDTTSQFMTGMISPINIRFRATESLFLKVVEYINHYPEPTSIASATLSFDGSTGELIGDITINRYILTGTGKKYEEPDLDDISVGTDHLFGIQ